MEGLIRQCQRWIGGPAPHYICASNVHVMVSAVFNKKLRTALAGASAVLPDGMPLVWFLRRHGHPRQERMYGPDVMLRLLHLANDSRLRIFLFGATSSTLSTLNKSIQRRFPRISISGTYSPPFKKEFGKMDVREQVRLINRARPHILFVGLGAPKQEIWMHRAKPLLRTPVILGAGAGFDFIAGTKSQAPRWMMRAGMEWLFRLCSEPRRLWFRYGILNPMFILLLAIQELHIWRRKLPGK